MNQQPHTGVRLRFEQLVLPHLDAAYNLARWLCADPHDAEDVVQETYLRAFRAFETFRGDDARCWLLAVVRNTCYTWLQKHRRLRSAMAIASSDERIFDVPSDDFDPQAPLIRQADQKMLHDAIEELPPEYREAIVLRELEELSYKQIAEVTGMPMGTVMSRLSRARNRLEQALVARVSSQEV